MVVAALALLFALTGGAIAASKLVPRNSVGSAQIINHSIRKVDLGTRLPRGPRGPAGPGGIRGPTGPQGVVSATHVYQQQFDSPPGDLTIHFVGCPAGTGVLSGGVVSVTSGGTWYDAPSGNGWDGAGDNFDGTISGYVRVYVECGQGAPAPTAADQSPAKLRALEAKRRMLDSR